MTQKQLMQIIANQREYKRKLESRITELEAENATLKYEDMLRVKDMNALLDNLRELETEIQNIPPENRRWCCGCSLPSRITELEKAQEWHPASDRPEHTNFVEGQTRSGLVFSVWHNGEYIDGEPVYITGETQRIVIFRYRNLPQLPETPHE